MARKGRTSNVYVELKMSGKRVSAAGAAKAGPGWADGESYCRLHSSANRRKKRLKEWIDDLDTINEASVLHIFG
jgi:hypothetical protein